jgi:hypothetical protein
MASERDVESISLSSIGPKNLARTSIRVSRDEKVLKRAAGRRWRSTRVRAQPFSAPIGAYAGPLASRTDLELSPRRAWRWNHHTY